MASPIFPTLDDLMFLILSELPENVYPIDFANADNSSDRSVSSSEIRAHAAMIASLYSNLNNINSDKFLGVLTSDGASLWERELFSNPQDSTLSIDQRQASLISKFRANGGISHKALTSIISSILSPKGIDFEISPWCGTFEGGMVLDDSELEFGTYLTSTDPILGAIQSKPVLDCDLDYISAGLTAQNLSEIQESAYMYELRIFGNVDDQTIAILDKILTQYEPARSGHIILNGHPGRDPVPEPAALQQWELDDSPLEDDTVFSWA